MMKKLFTILFLVIAVGFASCSDDDDNTGSGEGGGIAIVDPEGLVTVVNRPGELEKIIKEKQLFLVEKLKVKGPILVDDFDAFRNYAKYITYLDLSEAELPRHKIYLEYDDVNVVIEKNSITAYHFVFRDFEYLEKLILPKCLEIIDEWTFGIPSLEEVIMFDNVKIIKEYGFHHCQNLKSIRLSQQLEEICADAFTDNNKLRKIIIPAKVKKIGADAFDFSILNEMILLPTTPPEIDVDVYERIGYVTLYVPKGCKAVYEAHEYWGRAGEIIE